MNVVLILVAVVVVGNAFVAYCLLRMAGRTSRLEESHNVGIQGEDR